ncbi:unnamed protein product [Linum trigynum]|uniref:S-protein homolog n=1 Tax=Linum trigynum TaxID=586398 RepID=A0AAV2DZK7_9ROSI
MVIANGPLIAAGEPNCAALTTSAAYPFPVFTNSATTAKAGDSSFFKCSINRGREDLAWSSDFSRQLTFGSGEEDLFVWCGSYHSHDYGAGDSRLRVVVGDIAYIDGAGGVA